MRTGTVTGVETRGRTQDENRDESGDGNESSSEDGNGNEDRDGDGNEGGIGESGGEVKKRKKPHKNCRCDQALFFRKRHHLDRQRIALGGTRQLRSQGVVPVHAHRTVGVTGSKGRGGLNGIGTGIGVEGGNGDGNGVGGGNGDGDRVGTGTGEGVEANEGAQDANGYGSRNGDGDGDGGGDPWTNTGWKRGRERGRKQEK